MSSSTRSKSWDVSSFGSVNCLSVILKLGVSHSESLEVLALFEKNNSYLVELFGEALLSSSQDVCLVRAFKEILKVELVVITTHSITDDKLRVDFPVFDSHFSGLLQIID